jgi:hypothetical protein
MSDVAPHLSQTHQLGPIVGPWGIVCRSGLLCSLSKGLPPTLPHPVEHGTPISFGVPRLRLSILRSPASGYPALERLQKQE